MNPSTSKLNTPLFYENRPPGPIGTPARPHPPAPGTPHTLGLSETADALLYETTGKVLRIVPCKRLIEVCPTTTGQARAFIPANSADFLLAVMETQWGANVVPPVVGAVARGFCKGVDGSVRFGMGEVVRVWEDFEVCFVDPDSESRSDKKKGGSKRVRFDLSE
ncbi:uncharacterized protein BJX67DRAFT_380981 [Aspergillus lucknowensis]|uniref:Uncharacterized protein n=1 Tax=Aspergillus lucknowensis TaxID=176173 RepID=A0ABR4LSX0_9EURO